LEDERVAAGYENPLWKEPKDPAFDLNCTSRNASNVLEASVEQIKMKAATRTARATFDCMLETKMSIPKRRRNL
jgi:hypothetical protein